MVSADPYGDLGTPLIDGRAPLDAARALLAQARAAGIHAIVLRHVTREGAAMQAITAALSEIGLAPHVLRAEQRACLDATRDADELLREALGPKKLKELRRQHNRLAEVGPVSFSVAKTPAEVSAAVDIFLTLEASGWKADRGTALKQHPGDVTFIRRATAAMAARGACEIITLRAGETPVAAGVVLRHQASAFWFKLGVDVEFAKYSPGVQLALELTRHLCADPKISTANSTCTSGPSDDRADLARPPADRRRRHSAPAQRSGHGADGRCPQHPHPRTRPFTPTRAYFANISRRNVHERWYHRRSGHRRRQ